MSISNNRIPTFSSFGDNFLNPITRDQYEYEDTFEIHDDYSRKNDIVRVGENFQISINNDRATISGKTRRITHSSSDSMSNLVIKVSSDNRSNRSISESNQYLEEDQFPLVDYQERKNYASPLNSRHQNDSGNTLNKYNEYECHNRVSRDNSSNNGFERPYIYQDKRISRVNDKESMEDFYDHDDNSYRLDKHLGREIAIPTSESRSRKNRKSPKLYNKETFYRFEQLHSRSSPVHRHKLGMRQKEIVNNLHNSKRSQILLDHSTRNNTDGYKNRIDNLIRDIGAENLINISNILKLDTQKATTANKNLKFVYHNENEVTSDVNKNHYEHHKRENERLKRSDTSRFDHRNVTMRHSHEYNEESECKRYKFKQERKYRYKGQKSNEHNEREIDEQTYRRRDQVGHVPKDKYRGYRTLADNCYNNSEHRSNQTSHPVHDLLLDTFKNKLAEDTRASIAKYVEHKGRKRKLSPQHETTNRVQRARLENASCYSAVKYNPHTSVVNNQSSKYADSFSRTADLYKSKWITTSEYPEQEPNMDALHCSTECFKDRTEYVSIDEYNYRVEDQQHDKMELANLLELNMDDITLEQIKKIKEYLKEKINLKMNKIDIGSLPSKSKKIISKLESHKAEYTEPQTTKLQYSLTKSKTETKLLAGTKSCAICKELNMSRNCYKDHIALDSHLMKTGEWWLKYPNPIPPLPRFSMIWCFICKTYYMITVQGVTVQSHILSHDHQKKKLQNSAKSKPRDDMWCLLTDLKTTFVDMHRPRKCKYKSPSEAMQSYQTAYEIMSEKGLILNQLKK